MGTAEFLDRKGGIPVGGVKRTLERIAGGASFASILEDLCSTIDAQGSGLISAVLLMDPDGKRLRPGPWGRMPPDDGFRDVALDNGLRAAWPQPLISKDNEVLGTFCIYHAAPCRPAAADLELMERAAHLALIAIEGERSRWGNCWREPRLGRNLEIQSIKAWVWLWKMWRPRA